MRTFFLLATTFILSVAASAQITYELSVKGAFAKVKLQVVDQDGSPVAGAKIWGGFSANYSKDSVHVEGFTDTNGEFVAQGKCNEFLRVDVTKEGYYHTEVKVNFWQSDADPIVKDGKWQPYGETRTVVLKKIKNLGQLIVPDVGKYEVRERKIPKFDVWLSFDLEKFDWIFPYGDGKHSDVLLRFHNRTTPYYNDFTDIMEISFTNNPYAGVYEMKFDDSSDAKTVYSANSNAAYKSSLTFVCEKTKGKKNVMEYLKKDSYFIFRTRTSVDKDGRLKSAHYGTIHGDWLSANDHIRITDGCFNPVENSCNIEDGYYLREAVKHY